MTEQIVAREGEPILSQDGNRILARWRTTTVWSSPVCIYSWHDLPPLSRFGQETSCDLDPVKKLYVVPAFISGALSVWRVSDVSGATEDEAVAALRRYMTPETEWRVRG